MSIYALYLKQIGFAELPFIFIIGFMHDLAALLYCLPFITILRIATDFVVKKSWVARSLLWFISYFILFCIFIFIFFGEISFWEEFGTRFNFIAVDYLIYTHEIIDTLQQEISLPLYLSLLVSISFMMSFICRKQISAAKNPMNMQTKIVGLITSTILAILLFFCYSSDKHQFLSNKYADELSRNGNYEFFAAFWHNYIDYTAFYKTIEKRQALETVRGQILQPNQAFIDEGSLYRINYRHNGSSQNYNIMLVVVESLSAEYMAKFGNKDAITPYLDKLADEGILFTNFYATGTRTVRGIEAVVLSVPPTPGSSIVRRKDMANMFNMSTVLNKLGYESKFIYGGHAYFDNLAAFFGENGYEVIDRASVDSNSITFSNAWGMCDEDLFNIAVNEADKSHSIGKNFFNLVLTTSNHRPFTFPDGKIDLPPGSRNAAVKYTDYSIQELIELSRTRPWFDNTVFVIVADHCAGSAGKISLPVENYKIPLIIYAPKILHPTEVKSLGSQIDVAPTILGILNLEYNTKFFGLDLLHKSNGNHKAFIGTYQLLGYMKENNLAILGPKNQLQAYKVKFNSDSSIIQSNIKTSDIQDIIAESISYYQTAYDLYINGKMKK